MVHNYTNTSGCRHLTIGISSDRPNDFWAWRFVSTTIGLLQSCASSRSAVGVSVSKEVGICERILAGAGLKTHLHAYGTNIEGDWAPVFAAVKQCHEALHSAGVPRISTCMRFGTRIDREQTMEDKVRSVEEKLIS